MEYKVGDKVRIKSLDWYNTNKDGFGLIFCNHICFDEKMTEFCGKTVTIAAQRDNKYYFISEDNCLSFWSEDMIECLVERHGKTYPYKIGDIVILKGNNRCATITDLKYNSWGNLTYYVKIDNDKDISVDYPTDLLLPYDNLVEEINNDKGKDFIWLYNFVTHLDLISHQLPIKVNGKKVINAKLTDNFEIELITEE